MSLIQEALKRQQQESDGTLPTEPTVETSAPSPADPPLAPQPPPETPPPQLTTPPKPKPQKVPLQRRSKTEPTSDPETEQPPKKKSKVESKAKATPVVPTVLGLLLLLALLIGSIGWAAVYGFRMAGIQMPWDSSEPQGPANTVAVSEPETPISESILPPVASATVETTPDVTPATEPEQKPAEDVVTQAATVSVIPVPETIETERTETLAEAPTPVSTPVVEAPPTVKAPPPVHLVWPAATISGIVKGGRGQGGAIIINDKVIGVGESIDGITVTAIEAKGAMLEYKKQRRFLKVGKSLE